MTERGHFMPKAIYEKHSLLNVPFERFLLEKVAELKSYKSEANNDVKHTTIVNEVKTQRQPDVKTSRYNKIAVCTKMQRPDGYYVMLKPKIPYPHNSMLTHAQQVNYRNTCAKVRAHGGTMVLNTAELTEYEEGRAYVASEQRQYIEYLKECFQQLKHDYEYVDIIAQRYVQFLLIRRRFRLHNDPQFYKPQLLLDMTPSPEFSNVRLRCDKVVLNVGAVPRVIIPVVNQRQTEDKTRAIGENLRSFVRRFPVQNKELKFDKTVCSSDHNSAVLASKFRCDVTIAGSSLSELMSSIDGRFMNDFIMPVEIKDVNVMEEDQTSCRHRVLIIDKPYRSLSLNAQDKSILFHKTGVKFAMTKMMESYKASSVLPKNILFKHSSKQVINESRDQVSQSDICNAPSMEDLETFGAPRISSKFGAKLSCKSPEKKNIKTESAVEIESSIEQRRERKRPLFGSTSPARKAKASLMDYVKSESLHSEQMEGRRSTTRRSSTLLASTSGQSTLSSSTSSPPVPSTALDEILASQTRMLSDSPETRRTKDLQQSVRVELENPSQYVHWRPPKTSSYSLWNLADLRLLIRTNQHGHLRDVATNKTKPVYLTSKVEYQPTMGCEVTSLEECARNWIQSYIRHKSIVLRARVHAYTSEILLVERIEHEYTLPPGCPYNPDTAQVLLHHILAQMISLPVGKYLLKYDQDKNQLELLISTFSQEKGSFTFDVREHMALRAKKMVELPPKWRPIDPEVEFPCHACFNRIPATFEPSGGLKIHRTAYKSDRSKRKRNQKKKTRPNTTYKKKT